MRRVSNRTHDFVEEIIDIGVPTLQAHLDTSEERANVAMREIAHGICQRFGGEELYVPRDREWALQLRDRALADDHARGMRTVDIAHKYKLSTRQVQIIVRHVEEHVLQREREAKKRRPTNQVDTTRGLGIASVWNAAEARPVALAATAQDRGVQTPATPGDVTPGEDTTPFKRWLQRKAETDING